MSEDRSEHPPTAVPGGGTSAPQLPPVATASTPTASASVAPSTTAPPQTAVPPAPTTGPVEPSTAPGPTEQLVAAETPTDHARASASAPPTTTLEYAPTAAHAPPTTPPRLVSHHSHPNSLRNTAPGPMGHRTASMEDAATLSGYGHSRPHGLGVGQPLPPLPRDGRHAEGRRATISEAHTVNGRRPGIDWIVPVEEMPYRERSVGERLRPTMETARLEREKYATKAKMTSYALNLAIGLQVLLGSLTTALSAGISGNRSRISTTVLGGLATVIASYLARMRGSGEPENSITRVKDLEHFIRDCEAFTLDYGHTLGDKYDARLLALRSRFEELLGNADRERKSTSPA